MANNLIVATTARYSFEVGGRWQCTSKIKTRLNQILVEAFIFVNRIGAIRFLGRARSKIFGN
jgi:hypothetical protein